MTHTFAGGGGGFLFEHRVTRGFVAELIAGQQSRAGGVISRIIPQFGPRGFDDITLEVEGLDGNPIRVHVQCRRTQPFAGKNANFAELLADAAGAIAEAPLAYATREKRLAIAVASSSPAHRHMSQLCELARTVRGVEDLVATLDRNRGGTLDKWRHTLIAAPQCSPQQVLDLLATLSIWDFDYSSAESRDSVAILNMLASQWDPPDFKAARALAESLAVLIEELAPTGSPLDWTLLQNRIPVQMPLRSKVETRRRRVELRLQASRERQRRRLISTGTPYSSLDMIEQFIDRSPLPCLPVGGTLVLYGPAGSGKTTVLERLYAQSLELSLDDNQTPLPIFITASDLGRTSLLETIRSEMPRPGPHVRDSVTIFIDGLDESAHTASDLLLKISLARVEVDIQSVVVASRPSGGVYDELTQEPRVMTQELSPLSLSEAVELISHASGQGVSRIMINPGIQQLLCYPLYAIMYGVHLRSLEGDAGDESAFLSRLTMSILRDLSHEDVSALEALAHRLLDSGESHIDLNFMEVPTGTLVSLAKSRIIDLRGGRAAFQHNTLMEWLGARSLLANDGLLREKLISATVAHRWRYALLRALEMGGPQKVDELMTVIVQERPGLSYLLMADIAQSPSVRRVAVPDDYQACGRRLQDAKRAWLGTWPGLGRTARRHQTMAIRKQGIGLIVASNDLNSPHGNIAVLPDDVTPLSAGPEWSMVRSGTPSVGHAWPWVWTWRELQKELDQALKTGEILKNVPAARAELAWNLATTALRRSRTIHCHEIPVSELRDLMDHEEKVIREALPSYMPPSGPERKLLNWLEESGIDRITDPNVAWDKMGDCLHLWWSDEALAERVHLATRRTIEIYTELVNLCCPSLADELGTYLLLPARFAGRILPEEESKRSSVRGIAWWVEPTTHEDVEPLFSFVESHQWGIEWLSQKTWEIHRKVANMRGEERLGLSRIRVSLGEMYLFEGAPSCHMALDILAEDLSDLGLGLTSATRNLDGTFPDDVAT